MHLTYTIHEGKGVDGTINKERKVHVHVTEKVSVKVRQLPDTRAYDNYKVLDKTSSSNKDLFSVNNITANTCKVLEKLNN